MLVTSVKMLYKLKVRLNGAGGPPVGEVSRLGGVTRLSL